MLKFIGGCVLVVSLFYFLNNDTKIVNTAWADDEILYLIPEVKESVVNDSYFVTANGYVSGNFEIKEEIKTPIVIKTGVGNGWCVDYVKYATGTTLTGDAYKWKNYIDTQYPSIGDIVVLNESRLGHVAIVTKVTDTTITISEQNYWKRYVVSTRILDIVYENIEGYIHNY